MKITEIRIQNLTVHRLTHVPINAPVVLFMGPQEAGKSTVAEAVSIALSGRSIRLPMAKDIPALVADPNLPAEARVRVVEGGKDVWYGGPIHAGKVPVLKVPSVPSMPPRSLAALFEWRKVMEMGPEARKEVLAGLLGLYDEARMRELIVEHVGNVPDAVAAALPNAAKATAVAVELRRGLKRALSESERQVPESKVVIDGKEFDLAAMEKTVIEKNLGLLEGELAAKAKEWEAFKTKVAHMTSITKQSEKLAAELASLPLVSVEELTGLKAAQIDMARVREELQAEVLVLKYLGPKLAKGQCLLVDGECERPKMQGLGAMTARTAEVEKQIGEVEAELKKIASTSEEKGRIANRRSAVEGSLDALKADAESLQAKVMESPLSKHKAKSMEELEAKVRAATIDPLEKRLSTGRSLLAAWNLYHATLERNKAAQNTEAVEAEIAAADELVKYLESGLRSDLLSTSMHRLCERIAQTSAVLPGHTVEVNDDLEILVDKRPVDVLSESERFRVFFLIQEAIAHLSGLRLLVVDRLEILRGDFQRAFMNVILGLAQDYDTILLFATSDQRPAAAPEGIEIFWVDKGVVERIR